MKSAGFQTKNSEGKTVRITPRIERDFSHPYMHEGGEEGGDDEPHSPQVQLTIQSMLIYISAEVVRG